MAGPLIATKLHVPKPRQRVVERPRLRALLDHGANARLTLLSAPAGFGKTTLLAQWLSEPSPDRPAIAWLSLDGSDDDPALFWPHLVAALRSAVIGAGGDLEDVPQATSPDDAFIAILLNQLTETERPIIVVLDDLHAIENSEIHARLAMLVEYLPPSVRVVASTRSDPPLPLARLRARGELVEIRVADLRMTGEETASYLNDVMGLSLSTADMATLEQRTEGWIAALQLAVISLRGRSDPSAFISSFAGSGRFVVDYLVEEVLQGLAPDIRDFLMRTCVLRRLNASLCDEIVDGAGTARGLLDRMERQNMFLVALDEDRQWFRYHHLFADVLNAHLTTEQRAHLPEIHRRASGWYERHGERAEAIHHALAAQDFEWAAELLERFVPDMRKNRQEALFRTLMQSIPEPFIRARPTLMLGYVGVLVSLGVFDGVEDRLRDAERALEGQDAAGSLRAGIELYRCALAQIRGDLASAETHARSVMTLAPAGDHAALAGATGFLGIVAWSRGELDDAVRYWMQCRNGLRAAGHVADVQGAAIALADILLTQGRLTEAIALCREAIDLAGSGAVRGVADVHASLAQLHLERGEIEAAEEHFDKCLERGDLFGLPQHPYRSRVTQAGVDLFRANWRDAIDELREAERRYVSDFFPYVRPIPATIARVQIRVGHLEDADHWAAGAGVTVDGEASLLREYENITLARLMLARSPDRGLLRFLERLRKSAETGGRRASVIELRIIEALALEKTGASGPAVDALCRALELAVPEGHARPFLDEGDALTKLLKSAARRGTAADFVRGLLGQMSSAPPVAHSNHRDLLDPLSDREIEVLRLLRTDLGGPEIARELGVSLNTLRTHTRNIFEKLGVNSRRAAVRRASELELLGHSSRR